MKGLNYNYIALLETILSPEEPLPDMVLLKYELINLKPKEIRELEAREMLRLYKKNWTYQQIADKFNMTDSGVYRRIKRYSP